MILDFYHSTKSYLEGYESFCYQNCLRLVLESNNVKYAPLYVNSSLSLIFETGTNNYKYNFRYHKNTRSLIDEYSNKVKRCYYNSEDDCNAIYQTNITRLKENLSPIILGVDTYYLPYTPYYHKNHARHTLLLCGFNEQIEEVNVVDWYEPWFFNGKISKSLFLCARDSECCDDGGLYSGAPILNNWSEIDIGNNKDWIQSPNYLLLKTLNLTLRQYYKPSNKEMVGINALRLLNEWITEISQTSFFEQVDVFKYLHKQIYNFTKRHKLFRQYLKIFYEYIELSEVDYIISIVSEVINEWETVIMLFLKASIIDSLKVRNKILENLNSIILKEEIIGEEIQKLCYILED